RQIHFVLSGKLLGESLQVVGRYFRLMLEDVVTKIIAQILSLRVEVSRKHSSVKRPVVHGQGKVVQDEWNFVGFCSLLLKQSVGATLGALKILKDDYRHLGALRRTQQRGVLCNDHCG